MTLQAPADRTLVSYACPEAFVSRTVAILRRLGYRILDADEYALECAQPSSEPPRPELLIVDESRLSEVLDSHPQACAELPIILLTGSEGVRLELPQIVGAVNRPVGLHDLYRLVQQVFEDIPRSTPRVATRLLAECELGDLRWRGSLISLSENGGLLSSSETPPLGSCFSLRFELPHAGSLDVRAEAAYQLLPDLGVVFSGLAPADREAIGGYVSDCILA
jgi:hypothetical protein